MPDSHDVLGLIHDLPCEVSLPDDWRDFFERTGPLPAHYSDERRFPRFYCRTEAALEFGQTLPAMPRGKHRSRVFVKDISRRAISFFFSEQLFPCEKISLCLPDGLKRSMVVVRCRKVQDRCYEIAGHFS